MNNNTQHTITSGSLVQLADREYTGLLQHHTTYRVDHVSTYDGDQFVHLSDSDPDYPLPGGLTIFNNWALRRFAAVTKQTVNAQALLALINLARTSSASPTDVLTTWKTQIQLI
jgi:hypothetical protein